MQVSRIGTFTTRWGESVVWDDQRDRLYFVDCGRHLLYWLDADETEPNSFRLPTMPTGVVLTAGTELVVVLEDGLYIVDADQETVELLAPNPKGLAGRLNDASADLDGNIVTGKLNMTDGPGSAWQLSSSAKWTMLDDDISNTNGPAVLELDGNQTLIIGDTSTHYYAYDYQPQIGVATNRRVFGDVTNLKGRPDGTTVDEGNGLWCALVAGAQIVRFTASGIDQKIAVSTSNPTDVTFGGADLSRIFLTSISGDGEFDGALLAIDGLEVRGRPEPRCFLG